MRQSRKLLVCALTAACLLMALVVMSGCRPSDALREIIYDQNSSTVDYENEQKFYINNDQAELEDEHLPSTEANEDKETTEAKQNIVVYSSDPNTIGFTAKQSLWAQIPEFTGLEASSTVNFRKSDDPTAPLEDLKTKTSDSDTISDDADATSVGSGSDPDDTVAGDVASSTSTNIEARESNDGANDTGQGDGDKQTEVPEDTYRAQGYVDVDLTGDYAKTPKVESIAAYGNVAILVQMIGGSGALAAADKELLNSDFSKVFKKHGSADIATGWSPDGETSDNIKVNAIIKSGAEALIVPSGSYLKKKDYNALQKDGVTVVQLYEMTNSKYIKNNAKKIGQMLSESKKAEYKDPENRASDYSDFFDDTIEDCCKAANGEKNELAGSDIYEKKNNKKNYTFKSDAKFTLLIDDYDTSASYTNSVDGWKPVSNGAALSTVGYATTPASFYIQAGGLINNAAYCGGSVGSGQIIVWQFNCNFANFAKKNWSWPSDDGGVAKSINVGTSLAGAWNLSLLTNTYLNSGAQASAGSSTGDNFGTDKFPKAIAATQQVKEKFIANSANENGIYHPYGWMKSSTFNQATCGKYTSGGTVVYSAVGVDNSGSTSNQIFSSDGRSNDGSIPDDDSVVVVNPHGLFSSWTEGGSPESFLEAAWVCDVVNDDSDKLADGSWTDYVYDFYDEFYDYSLTTSELKTITDGIAK